MRHALVFGGLSSCGYRITENLLNCGITVYTLSSALSAAERESEEERSLFFGRNALFHRADKATTVPRAEMVYLLDMIRADPKARLQLKARMAAVFEQADRLATRFFFCLSSTGIYGGRTPDLRQQVLPETPEGFMANQMELFFIENVKNVRPEKAVIFRTDQAAERSDDQICRFAAQLPDASFSGIEVVHFFTNQPKSSAMNQKIVQLVGEHA